MAGEIEKLKALRDAGVASEDDLRRLAELEIGVPGTETEVVTATSTAEAASAGTEVITDTITDPKKFKEAAEYVLNQEGFFKSAIVSSFEPNTDKPQRWFILETTDERVKKPNRGVIVCEFAKGSGIYRQFLDSLQVLHSFNEGTGALSYKMNFPYPCWADWSKDSKAIGGVKISGLKPITAKVEQAL